MAPAMIDTAYSPERPGSPGSLAKISDTGTAVSGNGCSAHCPLEARLAKSTMFRESDPFLRVATTTSDPGPLGFFSFGFCVCLYMGTLLGWIDERSAYGIYGFIWTFAGIGEIIVGLLEYGRRNVFACNAFLVYGFFWLGTALTGTLRMAGIWKKSAEGDQMSFVLWGFITLFFWAQTLVLNVALSVLFFCLMILFFLLGALETHPGIKTGVGAWGIVVGIMAFYVGVATLSNDIYGSEVVPVIKLRPKWKAARAKLFGTVGTRRFDLEAQ